MSRRTKHVVRGQRPPTKEVLCKNCDVPLEPSFALDYVREEAEGGFASVPVYTGKIYGYGYRSQGHFCTLTCGYRYGVRCVKAGVEFEKPDPVRANRRRKAKPKAQDPDAVSVKVED